MLAGFTGNANRMGRRRNHHHARQRHKNAFFIIYSIQKIKIKEVPKNLKILLRTHQESMTGEMNFHKSVTSCVFYGGIERCQNHEQPIQRQ